MPSKELNFTKGYNQQELDDWWKLVGYPGEAPKIPDYLENTLFSRGISMLVFDPVTGKKKVVPGQKHLGDNFQEGMDFRNMLGKYSDPFRERSGISEVAGGILNFGMTALGGPVGALMTNAVNLGNRALGNNDGTSYTDGKRSNWDKAGALAGALYSSLDGPGSYGASGEKAPGWVKNANTGVKLLGGAVAKPPEGLDFDFQGGAGDKSPSSGDALEVVSLGRERAPDPQNFLRYGMGPEHSFFKPKAAATPPPATGVAPPTSIPQPSGSEGSLSGSLLQLIKDKYMAKQGLAGGGTLAKHYPPRPKGRPSQHLLNFASLPGQRSDPRIRVAVGDGPLSQFVSKGTGAGGREDNIDAKLSENEYVIDAETVSLLGDGSPEKGAEKLDDMRKQIRRHKGQALAKGKISPDAKEGALQYLAEGGKVGALRSLFKRKPKPDPNAELRRIKQRLDDALSRKREEITPLEMTEHFERHYAARKARMAQEAGDVSDEGALQVLTGKKEGK